MAMARVLFAACLLSAAAPAPARVKDPSLEGWFALARPEGGDVELMVSSLRAEKDHGYDLVRRDVPAVSGRVPKIKVGAKVEDVNGVQIFTARLAVDPSRLSPALAR